MVLNSLLRHNVGQFDWRAPMSPCQQKKDKDCPKKEKCPAGKKEDKSNASVKADTKVNAAGDGKKGN